MNLKRIEWILLTALMLVLGFVWVSSKQVEPKIVTIDDETSSIIQRPATQSTSEPAPAETITESAVTESVATETNIEATTTEEQTQDKIDVDAIQVKYVNPQAPCPPKQFDCFAQPTETIIDNSCPSYKPVWAYYSPDKGISWMQVGCFATEIDAEKAIQKARKTGLVKKTPAPKPAIKETSPNAITPIETQPEKPAAPAPEPNKDDASKPVSVPELAKTEQPEPTKAESKPAEVKHSKEDLTVEFKGLLGLVSVEKRTYPNAEMKKKAIKLWEKDQKILEPDGRINEKYVVKKADSPGIPGH